jgi:hypothetical protein
MATGLRQRHKSSPHKEATMQAWQIKALELEVSALNRLYEFIREHALYAARGIKRIMP